MKKYLIVFELCLVFFAGNVSAQTALIDPKWKSGLTPDFHSDATTYEACEIKEGAWINSLDVSKSTHCLENKKENNEENFCTALELKYQTIKGTKVKLEDKRYLIDDETKVDCKDEKCTIDEGSISVDCYNEGFKKIQYENKTRCIIKNKYVETVIPAIDFVGYAPPEWYCPNPLWDFNEGKNPYDSLIEDGYFQTTLKNDEIYPYEMEENELKKDCSLRMFALSKSCGTISQIRAKKRENVENLRRDFQRKKAEIIWRKESSKMVEGTVTLSAGEITTDEPLDRWNTIKDLSFKDICGEWKNNKCSRDSSKETKDKKNGINDIQEWLKKQAANEKLYQSYQTPQEYVNEKSREFWNTKATVDNVESVLKEKWQSRNKYPDYKKEGGDEKEALDALSAIGGDNASKAFSELLKNKIATEKSAKSVVKYIMNRNMDLNISISVGQTESIEVSKYLRATNQSKEVKLALFETGEKDSINIFDKIIRLAAQTMGTLAILLLIISGVLMVFSQGDDNQLSKAKTVFIYTLIGLVVGFLSYTIVRFIIDTLLS
jgi:hypothetical protein